MPSSDRPAAGPRAVLPVILASASPRRRELLARFWGTDRFAVLAPDYDESRVPPAISADARALADYLPAGKIRALQEQYLLPDRYCALAADTLVVLDRQILGKPADGADAARQLRCLSGRTHQVLTGICLAIHDRGQTCLLQAVEETAVRFAVLDEAMINWYVATGEPLDKAGAYGIQGHGAALVERIDGCYYNVMGLPVFRLMGLLREAADRFISIPGLSDLLPWN